MARPGLTRHRKFARLARRLKSEALARGHLELLWEVAYENGDDLLGDAGDVEHLARWHGKAGDLVAALVDSGFIDETQAGFKVHDLWDHAPDYVRKRRSRESQRRTKGAELAVSADGDRPLTGQRPPNGRPRAPAPAPAPTQEEAPPPRASALARSEDQVETKSSASPGTVGPEGGEHAAPRLAPPPAPGGHPTEGATSSSPEQVARDTARAVGSEHRLRALADADLDTRYPESARLLAWLRERGCEVSHANSGAGRAATEQGLKAQGLEEVGPRVLEAWRKQPRPGLGWFMHEISPHLGRERAQAPQDLRFGVAPPSAPEAFGPGGYRAIE